MQVCHYVIAFRWITYAQGKWVRSKALYLGAHRTRIVDAAMDHFLWLIHEQIEFSLWHHQICIPK